MLRCGRNWHPTQVERFIETLKTSTRPAKVATDLGPAFLKGLGNPQGNDTLACELVGAELANMIGLSTPDFAFVNLDLAIPLRDYGNMLPGPAFVSRALLGAPSDGAGTFFPRLNRPEDLARLVVFDTWIRNADRHPPATEDYTEPNFDNLFFSPVGRKFDLIALDHSHCFVDGELDQSLGEASVSSDEHIYGFFPSFRPYMTEAAVMSAVDALEAVSRDHVIGIIQSIPKEWGPLRRTRDTWVDVIMARAELVARIAPEKLLAQGRLGL